MALARMDWSVQDGLGRALAGAQVFWCTQPATVPAAAPPSPLATLYTDLTGITPLTQPVLSDGFGHVDAYMDDSILYTVAIYHPLFGQDPLIYPDQSLGHGGGGGSTIIPFAGVPAGTIDGTNKTFTLAVPVAPEQLTVVLNIGLIPGLGYTFSWASGTLTIVYAVAPQPPAGGNPGDALYAYGFYSS
jgi:hypothetical protein